MPCADPRDCPCSLCLCLSGFSGTLMASPLRLLTYCSKRWPTAVFLLPRQFFPWHARRQAGALAIGCSSLGGRLSWAREEKPQGSPSVKAAQAPSKTLSFRILNKMDRCLIHSPFHMYSMLRGSFSSSPQRNHKSAFCLCLDPRATQEAWSCLALPNSPGASS